MPLLAAPCVEAPGGNERSDVLRRWIDHKSVADKNRLAQPDCEEDFLYPTKCGCLQETCSCNCRKFVFCEFCRSWQHQCCAQIAVGYRPQAVQNKTTKGMYDSALEYLCWQCIKTALEERSLCIAPALKKKKRRGLQSAVW